MTPPPSTASTAEAAATERLRRHGERAAMRRRGLPLPEPDQERSDASAGPDETTDDAPLTPAARPARFLADLVRAMQSTAQEARDAAIAGHHAEASALLEALRTGSAARSAELRESADREVAAIAEWSRAELNRIREETDRRIAERTARLEADLERETAEATARSGAIRELVERYRDELDTFHEGLLATTDPAAFAALAAAMPAPPSLEGLVEVPTPDSTPLAATEPVPGPVEAADPGPEPEAEPLPDPESGLGRILLTTDEPDPRLSALGIALRARRTADGVPAPAPAPEPTPVARPAATASPKAARTPEPPAAVETTRLVVDGLMSLAGIATFKKQIARRPGIQSLAVASSPSGEFIFTVVHQRSVDLASVVPGIAGFSAAVTGAARGELRIGVIDPEAS